MTRPAPTEFQEFHAISLAEMAVQAYYEIYHGATEEVWRAVYQTPVGVTPEGEAVRETGFIEGGPCRELKSGAIT